MLLLLLAAAGNASDMMMPIRDTNNSNNSNSKKNRNNNNNNNKSNKDRSAMTSGNWRLRPATGARCNYAAESASLHARNRSLHQTNATLSNQTGLFLFFCASKTFQIDDSEAASLFQVYLVVNLHTCIYTSQI